MSLALNQQSQRCAMMSALPTEITVIRVPASSSLAEAAFRLRREVFVVEQKFPIEVDADGDDPIATHFVAIYEGEVEGTLRILFKPEHAKIGRVAVRQHRRGLGIARRLMEIAMESCRSAGEGRFYLASQTDKVGIYEKLGFSPIGPEFTEAGALHQAMKTY